MPSSNIAFRRLFQQRLTHDPFQTPGEVVGWMGAVQGQEYADTKWSLGMRMAHATDDLIERAFNEGQILRTHMLRPTWHFVTPADIRWIQALTGPRVNVGNAYMYRRLGLDNALLLRCNDLLARMLEGGHQLTRVELGKALAKEGIDTADGMRLGYIIHHAELDAVVCSGPRRGKQFTYMLLSERAPRAVTLTRDEALAELTRRYYTSRGPATVHDFSWWSGLTIADVKTGIAMLADELVSEGINVQTYYSSAAYPPADGPTPLAFLLPPYDEFVIGYANFNRSRTAGQDLEHSMVFDSTIVHGGRFIGSWRRTFQKDSVTVQIAPFQPFTTDQSEAVDAAVRRYGQFTGLRVECIIMENDR